MPARHNRFDLSRNESLVLMRPLLGLITGLTLVTANPASAQESPLQLGWSFFPSLQLSAVYDDNILFTATEPEGTIYGRAQGTVDVARRSASSTFRGGYAAAAEVFPEKLDELTNALARQRASASLQSRVGERGTLDLATSYLESRSPSELIDDTGLELGRGRAEAYNALAGYSRRATETNSLSVRYNFGWRALGVESTSDVGSENTSHALGMGWQHRYSSRTGDGVNYTFQLFVDDQLVEELGLPDKLQTHVLTYQWNRQLNSRSSFRFAIGPRISQTPTETTEPEGLQWKTAVEAALSLSYRWSQADVSLDYARTQLQSFGVSGRVDSDRLVFRLGLDPSRLLQITLSPAAYRNTRAGSSTETFRFSARLVSPLTHWLSLNAEYRYTYQTGAAQPIGEIVDPGDRTRNFATMGITIGKSIPLE